MFLTFDRIKELAKQRGISLNKLEETLGYSRNTIYSMKNKKTNAERIAEIANYFNVSTDYLLGRTDNPRIAQSSDDLFPVTHDINEIMENVVTLDGRELTEADKRVIRSIILGYMENKQD